MVPFHACGGTYPSHTVGGAEAVGLALLPPGLEELLEHSRLCSLGHHLHAGAGWVVLGFDVALESEQNGGKTWICPLFSGVTDRKGFLTDQCPVESFLTLHLGGLFAFPHHHTGASVVQDVAVLSVTSET